ncbi:MAG: T9SS type A sorting domain-containing protein, partial [Bacteroidia bacterium]
IYPNPTNGKFRILGLEAGKNYISIYSVLGTCVYQSSINQPNEIINLSGIAKGMYIYQLKDMHGEVRTGKVILE